MKKIHYYVIVLLTIAFLPIKSSGQDNVADTTRMESESVDEITEQLDDENVIEVVRFIDQLLQDRETAVKQADPSRFTTDIIPVIVFLVVITLFFIPFYFNYKKIKGRQLLIRDYLEKGKEIPDILLSPSANRIARSDFHKGIILVTLGLGISLVLLVLKIENNYWSLGLIPVIIGIGYFFSHIFDKKDGNG